MKQYTFGCVIKHGVITLNVHVIQCTF